MNAIRIESPNIQAFSAQAGDTPADHYGRLFPELSPRSALACSVNGEVVSLHSLLTASARILSVTASSPEARDILRRSLCFALAACADRALPGRRLRIGHAVGRGFAWDFADGPAQPEDLMALDAALRELKARDLPIRLLHLAWREAMEAFTRENRPDTVNLLRHLNDPTVPVHQADGYSDLAYGALVSWTSQLPLWRLHLDGDGFVSDILPEGAPESPRQPGSPMLAATYREYRRRGEILEIATVGQLDDLVGHRRTKDLIQVSEALHQQKIARIAADIADRSSELRMVLIAGPSSSGKTTFAKKLSIQLTVNGLKPVALSLDDYFVNRADNPRHPDGSYDFEQLGALDIDFLNRQLVELFEGKEIKLPTFDFKEGVRRFSGATLRLPPGGVVVVEGIHGLNDDLTPLVPSRMKHRIYISALTQLNFDRVNRIATTDNRLLRRMVRDSRYRGHSAEATLSMWPSVRAGEDQYIFPYQDSADAAFNSALDYEICVLRSYAEPLLRSVAPDSPWYGEARRLLRFLAFFLPLTPEHVPDDSIMREFIGGSLFKY